MTYWIWIGHSNVDLTYQLLLRKGVEVGPFNIEKRQFEGCVMTPKVLKELDNYWGVYLWGPEESHECK